jgi:hypothetical protein
MVGQRDRFSGNLLFYDYLAAKRNPVFLNRNLVRALEIDQYTLQPGVTHGLSGDDHRNRSKWRPPTPEILDDIMRRQEASTFFYLEPFSIKPCVQHNKANQRSRAEFSNKSRALFSIRCTIDVAIHHGDCEEPCAKRLDPGAILSGNERDGVTTLVVNAAPMDPITFEEMTRNYAYTDVKSTYRMRLTINFSSMTDAAEFNKHLRPDHAKRTISKQASAVWDDILKVPKGKVILPLEDQQGPLHLGLEVAMYKICAQDTPALIEHNRRLRSEVLCKKHPTPQRETRYELTFVYGDKTVIYTKITCPHCLDRRKPADIDALRLHLDLWHDHLSYRVVNHEIDATGVQRWKFECEIATYKTDQRASDKAEEPFDVLVIPRQVPFDRRAYLDDSNDDYQRTARLDKSVKSTSERGLRTTTDAPLSIFKRKPPSEIQPRAAVPKKKYLVPKAPDGIRFFRVVSKRPLNEGEYVSESDDDIDETWIQQRKAAEKERYSAWSKSRRVFLTAFDLFMYEEGLYSDVHAEAALIRFAQCKSTWLWQNQVCSEFKAKIDELRDDGIVSQAAHSTCMDIVRKAESSYTDDLHSQAEPRDLDGDMEMHGSTPNPSLHAANPLDQRHPSQEIPQKPYAQTTELPFNQCLCGLDALASSRTGAVIECANLVSTGLPITPTLCCITWNKKLTHDTRTAYGNSSISSASPSITLHRARHPRLSRVTGHVPTAW